MSYLIHHFLEQSADQFPEKIAVIHGRKRWSYREVEIQANQIAHWFLDKGVKRGDRVSLLLRNSIYYIACYYGILKAGAVVVPVNTGIAINEVCPVLKDADPKILISEKHFLRSPEVLSALKEWVPIILSADTASEQKDALGEGGMCLEEITPAYPSTRPQTTQVDMDLSSIIYTSGSTGTPKGVTLSHLNVVSNTRSIVSYLELNAQDRGMVVLPFYYVYGKTLLNLHFSVGGSIVLDNRFTFPNAVLKSMIDEAVTGFAGVPSTFSILLNQSSIARMNFPDLRYLTQAGGHMPVFVKEKLLKKFPDKRIFIMYGATEASARLSYLMPEKFSEKMTSIGKPIPNVEMKIMRDNGQEAATGEEGEIVARGSNMMCGYWRNPEETRKVLKKGWYYTGDLGRMDHEGFFYVTGRKKDLIKSGIHKVSPKEIEEVLHHHPGIHEAAVIGIPEDTLGEAIKACIVLGPNVDLKTEDLMKYCEEYLPPYKIPHVFEWMPDLPKNESGKILKQKLIQAHSISQDRTRP